MRRIVTLLAILCMVTVLPVGSTASAATAWTVTASATPRTGSTVKTVSIDVTSSAQTGALVDLEVIDPAGRTAYNRVWHNQAFAANAVRSFSTRWKPPATADGTFTVRVGVYAPGWGQLYAWNDRAATFTVSASGDDGSTTSTTAAPATTTTGPATTTTGPATTTTTTTTDSGMPGMHMACPDIPDVTPIGAVPPALPMLCDTLNGTAEDTHTETANSWLDDFDHGATMAAMGGPYKRFEAASLPGGQTASFAHNNHWMVDVWAPNEGVGMSSLRPDRSFKFEDGKLIVETDVAAGIADEDGFAWPEITVTTSSSPDGAPAYGLTPADHTDDDLYAYGHFGGYDSVGIRLTGARPIMALYDTTRRGFPCGRVWELSWFQNGEDNHGPANPCPHEQYATVSGGGEWAAPGAVRTCSGTDPDTNCRDRFRWELTQDQITLYANGHKLMEHTAIAGKHLLPDSLMTQPVYVYFSDQVYKAPPGRVIRFHWDRVAVNPSTGPTPSPTCTSAAPCG